MITSNFFRMVFVVAVVLLILYDIATNPSLSIGMKAVFAAGILIIQVNNFFRIQYRLSERHKVLFSVSMVVNIIAIAIFMVLIDSPALGIFYIFPIVEMALSGRSIHKGLMFFHAFVYFAAMYVSKADVQNSLLAYFATLLLVFLFREISLERARGRYQMLNWQRQMPN